MSPERLVSTLRRATTSTVPECSRPFWGTVALGASTVPGPTHAHATFWAGHFRFYGHRFRVQTRCFWLRGATGGAFSTVPERLPQTNRSRERFKRRKSVNRSRTVVTTGKHPKTNRSRPFWGTVENTPNQLFPPLYKRAERLGATRGKPPATTPSPQVVPTRQDLSLIHI